jgi:hypothetical protein
MDQGAASTSSTHKDTPLPDASTPISMKRTGSDGTMDSKHRQRVQAQVADPHWALEKQHVDSIINFLIRY